MVENDSVSSYDYESPVFEVTHVRIIPSTLLSAYGFIALIFFSGMLDKPLNGSLAYESGEGESLIIQVFGSLIYLAAFGILLIRYIFWPKGVPLLFTNLTVGLIFLCGWVILSSLWSEAPSLSFRRSIAFVGTILAAWTLASSMPFFQLARLLSLFALGFIGLSVVLAIVLPSYAFHQASDMGNPDHIGLMRGTFGHKNEFARVLSSCILLLLWPALRVIHLKTLVLCSLLVSVIMLYLAGSAKVFIALPFSIAVALGFSMLRSQLLKAFTIFIAGGPMLLLFLSGHLGDWISALLRKVGRDDTMSGRDIIWDAAFRSFRDAPLVGKGYGAGWAAGARQEMQLVSGEMDVMQHAHNGYIQTLLDIGIIGLAFSLLPIAYLTWNALFANSSHLNEKKFIERLTLAFSTFFFLTNVTGSYLTNYNDIFTVMIVILAVWHSQIRRSYRVAQTSGRLANTEGSSEIGFSS